MKQIKIIIIAIVFASISLNVHGLLSFNEGCRAFPNQCDSGDGFSTQSVSIGQLITEAGGHFLESNSDFQIVLKKIELSETGLNDALGQAIQSMSAANAKYFEIWITSLSLEYDYRVIEKLCQFNYTNYQMGNNLNPEIFKKVEDFLKQGHVRELFQQAYIESIKIMEKLKEIQTSLECGKKVDISDYWRLNQHYLEFALFGQYCSEVFIKME